MAGEGQEKTEKPTERRLREARKKGTVTKSNDIISASVFLALLFTMPSILRSGYDGFRASLQTALKMATLDPTEGNFSNAVIASLKPVIAPAAMLIAVSLVVGVVGNVAQIGFQLSTEALNPKFDKLNPLNGFKRLFGKPALFDAFKSFVKLVLFSYLAYSVVQAHWLDFASVWTLNAMGAMSLVGSVLHSILVRIVGAWAVLAAIDYIFQKKQTDKQLMMTKDEVRREMKDAETSPELKGHRMRLARKFSKMRPAQAVREADVIITNPTHFAIAVQYDARKQHAPIVIAKGVDHLALKMRELAKEAKVPIVENRPLARALYKECEVGDYIPRDYFQAVAEVLAYVYRTFGRVRK